MRKSGMMGRVSLKQGESAINPCDEGKGLKMKEYD